MSEITKREGSVVKEGEAMEVKQTWLEATDSKLFLLNLSFKLTPGAGISLFQRDLRSQNVTRQ